MASRPNSIVTRFRAYQLGQAGSSFSYFADGHFTLIEGIITDINHQTLSDELNICGKSSIDTLHITSWDNDHCSNPALDWIFENLKPRRIEYPGYPPHTDTAKACLAKIKSYKKTLAAKGKSITIQSVDPDYISSLNNAQELGYKDIVYHPKQLYEDSNNNSTVKFFRCGSFNVLSLGDVQDQNISAMLRRCKTLCREIDVMILAHHGADNGFTNEKFLEAVRPSIAISSSNYDNHHGHPKETIRELLYRMNIRLLTTKTGDVVAKSIGDHCSKYQVTNLISNSSVVSSDDVYTAKKAKLLSMNQDSIRNLYNPGFKGLKRKKWL